MSKAKNPKRRKRIIIIGSALLVILTLFIYFRYYFVYSEGTRVGVLYKFSKKGMMYKTYEGEMLLPGFKNRSQSSGMVSNMFHFSVTDEELANKLMKCQGMDIELHYIQYQGALPWRGDSYEDAEGQYIVDKLIRIKDESPNVYGL